MKYLRLSVSTSVLIFALLAPAFAGEMPCPGVASPAPTTSAAGEMPGAGVAAIDPLTEITLNIAQSVLSLF